MAVFNSDLGSYNRGVKGKSHVSNRKVICLEIEIDPF
jgi:hypothetical protein